VEALELHLHLGALQRRVVAAYPEIPECRRALVEMLGDLERAAKALGREDEARAAQREQDALRDREFPANPFAVDSR
jgi:hypothetical protein